MKTISIGDPTGRPAEEWIYVPALALLGLVMALQWRRARRSAT